MSAACWSDAKQWPLCRGPWTSVLRPGVDLLLRGFNTRTLPSHPVASHTATHMRARTQTRRVNAETVCHAPLGFNPFPGKHYFTVISVSLICLFAGFEGCDQLLPICSHNPFLLLQLESCNVIDTALMCLAVAVTFPVFVFRYRVQLSPTHANL